MIVWLKVAIGVGVLYALSKTNTGAAVFAELRGCPAGQVPGSWFTCVPKCGDGEFLAISPGFTGIPAGTPYCAHHGGVTDESGGSGGDINPVAATGVDGDTISVNVAGRTQA